MKRPLPDILVVNELIFLSTSMVLLFLNSVYCTTCNVRPRLVSIQFENCRPVRTLVRTCEGQCSSYTRPSVRNIGELEHSCRCCDVVRYRRRRLDISCEIEGHSEAIQIRKVLHIPSLCRCRPCANHIEVISPEEQTLLDRGIRSIDTLSKP